MSDKDPIHCPTCGGTGALKTPESKLIVCPICEGGGYVEPKDD